MVSVPLILRRPYEINSYPVTELRRSLAAQGTGESVRNTLKVKAGFLTAVFVLAVAVAVPAADLVSDLLVGAQKRGLQPTQLAFLIVGPDGERVSHRADVPMIPASSLKLVTVAAALDRLGPEFRLKTELRRTGVIEDGVLVGDLVVVGRGDPGAHGRFTDRDPFQELERWCRGLQELGVKHIDGSLIGDDRYLAGKCRHSDWPANQLQRWYSAPSGALNLNDNCVDVHLAPRSGGARIAVWLQPSIPRWNLEGRIRPVTRKKKHI